MNQGLKMTAAGVNKIELLTSKGKGIAFFLSDVYLLNEFVSVVHSIRKFLIKTPGLFQTMEYICYELKVVEMPYRSC